MPKLYHCNTIYSAKPISDVNPLILEAHKEDKILVVCAKTGQVKRIHKKLAEKPYNDREILCFGIWDVPSDLIFTVDVVVILDKSRVSDDFKDIVDIIEEVCASDYTS